MPARTHGMTSTRMFGIWCRMHQRCHNPRSTQYRHYGGRGITVCERWQKSFEDFLADVGEAPSPRHTLDRIDNDRGYEPGNVRWATMKEQANNRRSNRVFELNGESLTLAQWAARIGVNPAAILYRLKAGWPLDKALTEPSNQWLRRRFG